MTTARLPERITTGAVKNPAWILYLPLGGAVRSSRQDLEFIRIFAARTLDASEHGDHLLTRYKRGVPTIRFAGLGAIRAGRPLHARQAVRAEVRMNPSCSS
jgi:hypothetical protein